MTRSGSQRFWIGRRWLASMALASAASLIAFSPIYMAPALWGHYKDEAVGDDMRKVSYLGIKGMERADLYYIPPPSGEVVQGVLVLCPGDNANGQLLLVKHEWREFARTNRLGLIGLSFASAREALARDQGSYRAEQESGRLVLESARRIYGGQAQLLVYGFSGGAHFTSNFINWAPQRVIAWCAYSAAWWDSPQLNGAGLPPGIIACGDSDTLRVDESYSYFKVCRMNHQRVTWVCLEQTAHELSPALNEFVRIYFQEMLPCTNSGVGEWRDVERLAPADEIVADKLPIAYVWLPSERSANCWARLHSTR